MAIESMSSSSGTVSTWDFFSFLVDFNEKSAFLVFMDDSSVTLVVLLVVFEDVSEVSRLRSVILQLKQEGSSPSAPPHGV